MPIVHGEVMFTDANCLVPIVENCIPKDKEALKEVYKIMFQPNVSD